LGLQAYPAEKVVEPGIGAQRIKRWFPVNPVQEVVGMRGATFLKQSECPVIIADPRQHRRQRIGSAGSGLGPKESKTLCQYPFAPEEANA